MGRDGQVMTETDQWVEVFVTLRSRLVRLVRGIAPPKEVEDIVQETFVRVCQIENKESIREPNSYVFRTARNLALDHVKRSESRLADGGDALDRLAELNDLSAIDADPTYAQVASGEEFALFCEAVRELPKQCRRAFVLKKVYGYTLKEIADEMGVGLPTVETHIVNGTKKCVQYMRDRNLNRHSADNRRGSGTIRAHSSSSRRGGDA
jgi:RNA polymerase sigma factor (sigma-70 family)